MKIVMIAMIAIVIAVSSTARVSSAESLDDAIRAELAPRLTANVGIAAIHLEPALASIDIDRSLISIEAPRELRVGRQSVKLVLRGRRARTVWVPVSFARLVEVAIAQRAIGPGEPITADDFATELRAVDVPAATRGELAGAFADRELAAGAVITPRDITRPPPLPRGAIVDIDVRRGGVRVRGTGVLEIAARPGDVATARIGFTNTLVHGTLVAPATLLIGDAP